MINSAKSPGLHSFLLLAFVTTTIWMTTCLLDVDGAPYQELEPRKGHVPVYIRYGDTPLSEIHPGLAEAFHEENFALPPSLGSDDSKVPKSAPLKTLESAAEENKETKVASQEANSETEKKLSTTESDIASFDVVKGSS